MSKRLRRNAGRSPLDKLPAAIRSLLIAKCFGPETFREIRAWLRAEHGVRTSLDSLSRFTMRREAQLIAERNGVFLERPARVSLRGGMQIKITALSADEALVHILPGAAE